jgi:hypothetical protein
LEKHIEAPDSSHNSVHIGEPRQPYDSSALKHVDHVARRQTLPALSRRMHEQNDFALTILSARKHFFDEPLSTHKRM